METPPRKYVRFLLFLALICITTKISAVEGGECGRSSPDQEALSMMPCMSATKDPYAKVSDRCCYQVRRIGQNFGCLCSVMLSNTAKLVGSKPEVAITIPKRCNIYDRPVGYNCGGYVLP